MKKIVFEDTPSDVIDVKCINNNSYIGMAFLDDRYIGVESSRCKHMFKSLQCDTEYGNSDSQYELIIQASIDYPSASFVSGTYKEIVLWLVEHEE